MFKPALLAVCVSLLLTACLPVFVPLSLKNEATPQGLEGTWINDEAACAVSLDKANERYLIDRSSLDGKGPKLDYVMTVSKIGDELYASIAFDIEKAEKSWPADVKKQMELNVFPQFWLFRLLLEGDSLKLLVYDEKLASLPKDEEAGDSLPSPIAADRKALREWLAKNGAKAFKENDGFVYKRKAAEAK